MYDQLESELPPWRKDQNNIVLVDDLIVTFPMHGDQIDQVESCKKRYLHTKRELELQKPTTSSHILYRRVAVEKINKFDNWNQFETRQITLVPKRDFFGMEIDYYCDDITNACLGNYNSVAKTLDCSDLGQVLQFPQRSMKEFALRDRTGRIFKLFTNRLRKMNDPSLLLYPSNSLGVKDPEYSTTLGKQLDNGTVKCLKMFLNDSGLTIIKSIIGEDRPKPKVILFNTKEESQNCFKIKFFKYTGLEFHSKLGSFESKEKHYYGDLKLLLPLKYQIPSYKKICINTLKEMYLVNRQDTIEKIIKLPNDLLLDFLDDCMLKEIRPVGFEIASHIKSIILSNNDKKTMEQLFPWKKWINSIYSRDMWFYDSYHQYLPQNIFYPPYNENNLAINVYNNLELFKFSTNIIPLENIVFYPINNNNNGNNNNNNNNEPTFIDGKQSIVSKDEFIKNFNLNTQNVFINIQWDNIMVIGGIVSSSITGRSIGYETSDIDVYFYGCKDDDHQWNVLNTFVKSIQDLDKYCISTTDSHIILIKPWPARHIQINFLNIFHSKEQLLLGVDIEAGCFGFDGTNVWTMQRGIEAVNTRFNIAHQLGHRIREPSYVSRLLKYLKRGFGIATTLDLDKVEKKFSKSPLFDNPQLYRYQNGIGLLYAARLDKTILETLVTPENILPIGPEWDDIEKIREYILNRFYQHFDGYNSSIYPQVSDDINDALANFSASDILDFTQPIYNFDQVLTVPQLFEREYQMQ